jgi:hypothetical protein
LFYVIDTGSISPLAHWQTLAVPIYPYPSSYWPGVPQSTSGLWPGETWVTVS